MKPNIGITNKNRAGVIQILNRLLADEYVLYTRTRKFHWNVTGPQFNDLHKFFEAQYEALNDIVDEVAERIRTLGEMSAGTLTEFLKETRLEERPGRNPHAAGMLVQLMSDHEALIRHLRKDLETAGETHLDRGTSDFLTGLMEKHEKMAWMLRSFQSAA